MGLFGKAAGAVLPFGILDLLDPDRAEAGTYPGFVKQFPKLVTRKGRKELIRDGLLDENGRFYVGTLEPNIYDTLRMRDKSYKDDNIWISRHAPDQRMREGVTLEELAREIAYLVDNNQAKILGNFPTRFPDPDRAKWILAGRYGDAYTAAPLRPGDFGDVELKTVFKPQYDKKTYLDKIDWGGPRLPYMVTLAQSPEQSISQPQGLSAVNQPYRNEILPDANQEVKIRDPEQYGGLVGYIERGGNPVQDELVAASQDQDRGAPVTWDDIRHGLSYGTRAALEGIVGAPAGLMNMVSEPLTGYSFPNAGITLADAEVRSGGEVLAVMSLKTAVGEE